MRLAEYGPPENGVCKAFYRLRKRGEKPTIDDLVRDGDTFQVVEERKQDGKPPQIVFIPGCCFAWHEPAQRILYPGE